MKGLLERILTDDVAVLRIQRTMEIGADYYFLCTPMEALGLLQPANPGAVVSLTTKLREAASLMERGDSSRGEDALERYQSAAKWSVLEAAGWGFGDKTAHFIQALSILPDNGHCIDRLAATLAEGPSTPAMRSARRMLLHFAVLRGVLQHPLQRPLHLVRGIAARPFWDEPQRGESFPWLQHITSPEKVAIIRKEAHAAVNSSVAQSEGIHLTGRWGETHLIKAGRIASGAAAHPRTMSILQSSGGDFINARFSYVHPGTHISPHCGVSNAKLRAHLALTAPPEVPPGNRAGSGSSRSRSGLRVGEASRSWVQGEAFIFDDSFEHEVFWRYTPAAAAAVKARGGQRGAPQEMRQEEETGGRMVLILDVSSTLLGLLPLLPYMDT